MADSDPLRTACARTSSVAVEVDGQLAALGSAPVAVMLTTTTAAVRMRMRMMMQRRPHSERQRRGLRSSSERCSETMNTTKGAA